ncbi:MAG: hypothetical protein ACPGRC_08770 [Salibacteraceae bacterium]
MSFSPTKKIDPLSNRLTEYSLLNSYQNIYERNKLKRPIQSKNEISYSAKIPFGSSIQTVKAVMTNKPIEALFNTYKLNRQILLFTEKHKNHQVQIEMHFNDNKLFFFKFLFPEANQELRHSLMKGLISKYDLPNVDLTLHTAYDKNNHCIQVRDLNTFEILFTNLEASFFDKLVKQISKSNNQLLADYHLTSSKTI